MADQFWADATLEPKRQHRWLLTIGILPPYIIKRIDKPSFIVGEAEHNYFGHAFYYPGMVKWDPITLTLVDPVKPDATSTLMSVLKQSGYEIPRIKDASIDSSNALHTITKANAVAALGTSLTLTQISTAADGINRPVEEWMIYNPWIKDVKFGSLDYTSDAMVEITMTIRYDYAEQKSLV